MRKKYKVLFEIEGSIEISARNDEDAGDIIDRMERDRLFELCDEFGCKTYPIEMGAGFYQPDPYTAPRVDFSRPHYGGVLPLV